jgi:hypothetical protein
VGRRVLGQRPGPGAAGAGRAGFGIYGEVGYLFEALPVAAVLHFGALVPQGAASALERRREAAAGLQYFLGVAPGAPATSAALRLGADYVERWVVDAPHERQVRVQLEATL